MDSILISIKKMLGIEADYTQFDADIIMNINTVFMVLNQLGVGPEICFSISDSTPTWKDFLGDRVDLEAVKIYVYFKVRLAFDPPATAFVLEAMERQIREIEWRLNVQVDKPETVVEEVPIVEG
jgi:hypothetical protein